MMLVKYGFFRLDSYMTLLAAMPFAPSSVRSVQLQVWIHLRGEDLGHSDYKFSSSQRVHFIAEAARLAIWSSLASLLTIR